MWSFRFGGRWREGLVGGHGENRIRAKVDRAIRNHRQISDALDMTDHQYVSRESAQNGWDRLIGARHRLVPDRRGILACNDRVSACR